MLASILSGTKICHGEGIIKPVNYIAFLRGIGPGNPNMHNDKLRKVFEGLGFADVRSVISSGNIIFATDRTDTGAMEAEIEAAWPKQLGFSSTTIIRSQAQIEQVIASHPFKGLVHGPGSYLLVTFLKHPTDTKLALPYQPEGKTYKLLSADKLTLFTTTDSTTVKTTDLMTWLENQFGKQISSRTLATVNRILAKMHAN